MNAPRTTAPINCDYENIETGHFMYHIVEEVAASMP